MVMAACGISAYSLASLEIGHSTLSDCRFTLGLSGSHRGRAGGYDLVEFADSKGNAVRCLFDDAGILQAKIPSLARKVGGAW